MALFRTLRSHRLYTYVGDQNPQPLVRHPLYISSPITHSSFSDCQIFGSRAGSFLVSISSFLRRQLSTSPELEERSPTGSTDSDKVELAEENGKGTEETKPKHIYENVAGDSGESKQKSLDEMFSEAVDGSDSSELESEGLCDDSKAKEVGASKTILTKLENEATSVKAIAKETVNQSKPTKNDGKTKSLYALFVNRPSNDKKSKLPKPEGVGKPKSLDAVFVNMPSNDKKSKLPKREGVYGPGDSESLKKDQPHTRELSPEMVSLVRRLHEEGYLNKSSFLSASPLDLSRFNNDFCRDFLRSAAIRFGRDQQEIAKCLSGSELKKVALFGCPSLEKKTTFAAKRLRNFFKIQEDTVCQTCEMKESCKFANKRVWDPDNRNLVLADVMKILTSYALEFGHPQLVIPSEIKTSTSKLLKDVLNISQ